MIQTFENGLQGFLDIPVFKGSGDRGIELWIDLNPDSRIRQLQQDLLKWRLFRIQGKPVSVDLHDEGAGCHRHHQENEQENQKQAGFDFTRIPHVLKLYHFARQRQGNFERVLLAGCLE